MMLAKWIAVESYSEKDYYYALSDVDVFDYSFKNKVDNKKVVRRKLEVYNAHNRIEGLPLHIRMLVTEVRKASVS